ncbi:MAG: DUF5709 domain-containing protein [Streptosporangiaceae bacterium]
MADEKRHESADLEDYEVLDTTDTLEGAPGDDPLDRGVAAPERWSAAMRFGSTGPEQAAGESLDQLIAEEEPDIDIADDRADRGWDENATDQDIARLLHDQSADARAGRLTTEDTGDFLDDDDLIAHDAGIDGGGATAEEAAIHVIGDEDPGAGTSE